MYHIVAATMCAVGIIFVSLQEHLASAYQYFNSKLVLGCSDYRYCYKVMGYGPRNHHNVTVHSIPAVLAWGFTLTQEHLGK